jgi:hypothetical protein
MEKIKSNDLNEIDNLPDLKLHIKNIQEDLWGFIGTIKSMKNKQEKQEIKIQNLKNGSKLVLTCFGISLILILMKKK